MKFKKFTIQETAFNPYFFKYEDITIKLCCVQKGNGLPDIEVFENTKEAEKGEWCIYGANDEKSEALSFKIQNEIKTILVKNVEYEILFERCKKEKYKYSKITEIINACIFGVRKK